MNSVKVLYRSILFEKEELDAAKKYFECTNSILDIEEGDVVIARYSVLPYYQDVESDIIRQGGKLLNSFAQHRYAADLGNYVEDLKELTPKTYCLENVPEEGGPYIVKGETNSRRSLWKTHMFAKDRKQAIETACRLMEDSLIGSQKIYVREYVPLDSFFEGLDGVPVAREFRVFVFNQQIISGGYYWTTHVDTIRDRGFEVPSFDEVPKDFLGEMIRRIGSNINFYAVDVAKTKEGKWIVIELNDGQMAGLSENDPNIIYSRMKMEIAPCQ